MTDIKTIYEDILTGKDMNAIVEIPLKDLIWTIICYSNDMRNIEDEVFSNYPFYPRKNSEEYVNDLIQQKEYCACRRDELARLISQYSNFDTRKIWKTINPMFKDYGD